MTFSIGQSERERLAIDVRHYERQPTGEYWDDNWLTIEMHIHVGAFQGKAHASIQASELIEFLSQLRRLHETLSGTAEFTTLEEQLHLLLASDGKGHIKLSGEMMDQAGIGNQLKFNLEFDQSQLANAIRELDAVITKFPVRNS